MWKFFERVILKSFQLYDIDTHLEEVREMVIQKCRFVV